MTKKVIVITERWPRSKAEKKIFGMADVYGQTAEIFINKPANKKAADHIDTLYHEFTHALIRLYQTPLTGRKDGRKEERLCRTIGKAATEAFKKCLSA